MASVLNDQYLRQPREVAIETLALCNARCTFCPYPTLERKGATMGTELFTRLVMQMSQFEYPFFVSPFKVNEPLLDKRLERFCYAIEECCPLATLRLFTNGSPLTAHNMQWIGALKRLEHLWISLNSTNAAEYERVMGLEYDKTAHRLDVLHKLKKNERFRQNVVISRVTAKEKTLDVYGEYQDREFIADVERRWPLFRPFIIKRDAWLGYVDPLISAVPQAPCERWWEMSVTATGKVALCCMDGVGEFSIGDVKQNSLLQIYNQPLLLNRRKSALDRTGIEPCQRCSY